MNLNLIYFVLVGLTSLGFEPPEFAERDLPADIVGGGVILAVCAIFSGSILYILPAAFMGCFYIAAVRLSLSWFGKIFGGLLSLFIVAIYLRIAFFLLNGGVLLSPLDFV